jgi:PAS domain S-box-containing protein
VSPSLDLAALVAGAADAIVVADREGRVVLWNGGAERLFGFAESEALGQSLDLIIPERFRARHWDGYRATMETGHTRHAGAVLQVPAVHRDGRRMSIAFTVALLADSAGRVTAIGAILRDDTARWQAERDLRARLAALETKTIPA